jgi:dephospho-CoA kinase
LPTQSSGSQPLKVGLTGNIGSGKSTATRFFADLGIPVFDADSIGHELLESEEIKYKIVKLLGERVLTDHKIDRRSVSKIIFDNPTKRAALENILHPAIMTEIENRITSFCSNPYVVVEASLIYEAKLEERFDYIILVKAKKNIAVERAVNKLGLDRAEVLKRMHSQISQNEKEKFADFVIANDGSPEDLKKRVQFLHSILLSLAEGQHKNLAKQRNV